MKRKRADGIGIALCRRMRSPMVRRLEERYVCLGHTNSIQFLMAAGETLAKTQRQFCSRLLVVASTAATSSRSNVRRRFSCFISCSTSFWRCRRRLPANTVSVDATRCWEIVSPHATARLCYESICVYTFQRPSFGTYHQRVFSIAEAVSGFVSFPNMHYDTTYRRSAYERKDTTKPLEATKKQKQSANKRLSSSVITPLEAFWIFLECQRSHIQTMKYIAY